MYHALEGTTLGFTASRSLRGRSATGIRSVLHEAREELGYASGFVTGGCVGGDTLIGTWLMNAFPLARHVVVVPANRSRVSYWWEERNAVVIEMEEGTDYRDRNLRIVAESNRLWGFPQAAESDERSVRSGSWQTLRLARRHHDPYPSYWLLDDLEAGRQVIKHFSGHDSVTAPRRSSASASPPA